MSRIAQAMLRDGKMTAAETVAIYAMVTALTQLGVPPKRVLAQLMRMVPAAQLSRLQEDFEKLIDGMVEPEAPPGRAGGP